MLAGSRVCRTSPRSRPRTRPVTAGADLALGPGRVRRRDLRRAGKQDHRPAPRTRSSTPRKRGRRRRGPGRGRWPGRRDRGPEELPADVAHRVCRGRGGAVPGVRLAAGDGAAAADRGLALGTGIAVIGLLSHVITMASFSSELSLLIGLGVGIDYALFIVTRSPPGTAAQGSTPSRRRRRARHLRAGGDVRRHHRLHRAARACSRSASASSTASRSRPRSPSRSPSLAALTLLPALLGFFGLRVLRRRKARRALRQRATGRHRRVARLGALGSLDAGASRAVRRGRGRGDDPARDPVLLDPARLLRRRHRPARQRPPARPTTCSPRASGPATTARCSSSPRSTPPRSRRTSRGSSTAVATDPRRRRRHAAERHPRRRTGRPGVATADVYPVGSPQDASTSNLLHTVRDSSRSRRRARAAA